MDMGKTPIQLASGLVVVESSCVGLSGLLLLMYLMVLHLGGGPVLELVLRILTLSLVS